MSTPEERPVQLRDTRECRELAEDSGCADSERLVWALLAVAGELAEIRREMRRQR